MAGGQGEFRESEFTEDVRTSGRLSEIDRLIKSLGERIVGQSRALRMLYERLKPYHARMNDPELPAASLFCLGPTGVGKTELAKQFARLWLGSGAGDPFTKVDCPAFENGHEVSKLTGSPPGYVGERIVPLLSQQSIDSHHFRAKAGEALRNLHDAAENADAFTKGEAALYKKFAPYRSVILFDEIEKGHASLRQLLLSILGEARLDMMRGGYTRLNHSVIFITSNLGAEKIVGLIGGRGKVGFALPSITASLKEDALDEEVYECAKEELQRKLSPELMGRLRHDIVVFRHLKREDYKQILEIQLEEAGRRLNVARDRRSLPIEIFYSEQFREFLLERGIDPRYGARPLKAQVNRFVVSELSGARLAGGIRGGDRILFMLSEGRPKMLKKPRQATETLVKYVGDAESDENSEKDENQK